MTQERVLDCGLSESFAVVQSEKGWQNSAGINLFYAAVLKKTRRAKVTFKNADRKS